MDVEDLSTIISRLERLVEETGEHQATGMAEAKAEAHHKIDALLTCDSPLHVARLVARPQKPVT